MRYKLAFGVFFLLASIHSQGQGANVNVVIVAVSEFKNQEYENLLLSSKIKSNAVALRDFFKLHIPGANIVFFNSADSTSHQNLHRFFRTEFEKIASKSLTLLFVISHGISRSSDNPVFASDLLVVTSDTDPSNLNTTTISVNRDIIGSIELLPPGSVVLTFLDTCHSGAVDNMSLRIQSTLQNYYGIKMMLIASTLSREKAYQASFTSALVEMWNESNSVACLSDYQISNEIRARLKKHLQLEADEGHANVVIPYCGNLCIDSFAKHSGLVLFFNPNKIALTASIKDLDSEFINEYPIAAQDVVPIRLSPVRYSCKVSQSSNQIASFDIDLKAKPLNYYLLGSYISLSMMAPAFEKGYTYANLAGINEEITESLRRNAYSAYVNAGDYVNSARIDQNGSFTTRLEQLFLDKHYAGEKMISKKENVANELVIKGLFSQAAQIFFDAAKLSDDKNEQKVMAIKAYFASGAAKRPDLAESIRQLYAIDRGIKKLCVNCPSQEGKVDGDDIAFTEKFRSISTALSLLLTQTPTDELVQSGELLTTKPLKSKLHLQSTVALKLD